MFAAKAARISVRIGPGCPALPDFIVYVLELYETTIEGGSQKNLFSYYSSFEEIKRNIEYHILNRLTVCQFEAKMLYKFILSSSTQN